MAKPRHLGFLALIIVLAAVAAAALGRIAFGDSDADPRPRATRQAKAASTQRPLGIALHGRRTGTLTTPVQDAATVTLDGSRALLAGGLTAADISTASVRIVTPHGSTETSRLWTALHDAAAARLGGKTYVFGGGDGIRQLSEIVPVGARGVAARLPEPSSDQAAAVVDGTAYVVGGYTGTRWLNTIVAWKPGAPARVVARLPDPVRYAAVTAAGGRVIVAGGSLQSGEASRAVLEYDPGSGRVRKLGRLPAPTTHAAAAALDGRAYVIGGRSALVGTPTARVVAVDPATGRVRPAGRLPVRLSDESAASVGRHILVAGGRSAAGTVSSVFELTRARAAPHRARIASRQSAAPLDVYAADGATMIHGAARHALPRVYVPNSDSNTVDVIDPSTYRIVSHFSVGALPQHVTPSWDLKTLYVLNDEGNSLTPIDPRTAKPGRPIPVDDPYNMYFTPDGRNAIVVAERLHRLDFRDPHTFRLKRSVEVPCRGVDHMDFSRRGGFLVASCEFSGQLIKVDVARKRVVAILDLPGSAMPQDVKLSPDGRIFYVADMQANGLWEIRGRRLRVIGFLHTGRGVHGLYASRNARELYATNRGEGTVSVISFRRRKVVATWHIPGGSPDMGNVSADGKVLWLSGRYDAEVYAISTRTGKLLARIPVGRGPHGLCVWPQPGRYSLGHTGILR